MSLVESCGDGCKAASRHEEIGGTVAADIEGRLLERWTSEQECLIGAAELEMRICEKLFDGTTEHDVRPTSRGGDSGSHSPSAGS